MSNKKASYKAYHIKNKAKRNAYSLAYSAEHKEEKKAYDKIYRKAYYAKNTKKLKADMKIYNKVWYVKNAEKRKAQCKAYSKVYKTEHVEEEKAYRKKNAKKIYERGKKWARTKYKTSAKFKLNHTMAGEIRKALKGNKAGRRWETLVGYTLDDLIKQLKKTLPKGYIWADYLDGTKLHLDHIIPRVVFNYTKPEHTDFKKCWS